MDEPRKLFVSDLDDFLIDNTHDYAEPIANAALHIIKSLGSCAPHFSKIVEMIMQTDSSMVHHPIPGVGKQYGYSIERFPSALSMTYHNICLHSKIKPKPEIENEMYDIGMTAFDSRNYYKKVKQHAIELIQFIKRRGDILVLCTKGDERVQNKKIVALVHAGLSDINDFNDITIVPDKTPEIFRSIKEKYKSVSSHSAFSMGNSFRSDIEPALKVDYKGILIPVEVWNSADTMAHELSLARISGTHIFDSLRDIVDNYDKL